jgi:hypothetical protein
MPDPHRLERELSELLARPQYANLFSHRNQFRNPKDKPETPQSLAARTTAWIMQNSPFYDPVTVEEMKGSLELYRAYDGISHQTALTLGRCWLERPVLESIWSATARWQGSGREAMFMDFLRSANFIHPQWNKMTDIACMQVPYASSVVVVRGKGTWKAMRSKPGAALTPSITSAADVMDLHGSMPIPGTYQCVIPLYNDMWVRNVPKLLTKWPLLT